MEVLGGPDVLPPTLDSLPRRSRWSLTSWPPWSTPSSAPSSSPRALGLRHPGWTAGPGGFLVGLGLVVAVSGLWMTLAYPQKEGTGYLLWGTRLLVSVRHGRLPSSSAWSRSADATSTGTGPG